MIGAPFVYRGARQRTSDRPAPAVAVKDGGGRGVPTTSRGQAMADKPVPTAFSATTTNVYCRPFASPAITVETFDDDVGGTTTFLAAAWPVETVTTYRRIGEPPSDLGAFQLTVARALPDAECGPSGWKGVRAVSVVVG